MILHNEPSFLIYFGDAKDRCVKSENNFNPECFQKLQERLNLEKLVFLKQMHGIDGLTITDPIQIKFSLNLFDKQGDFIITNLRKVGIGILTADCLPLVFYDPVHHAVGIAHVGWKGLIAGIIPKVAQKMQNEFKTNPTNLDVFLGPCAKACCYQVDENFLHNLENSTFAEQVTFRRNDKIFFNIPRFAKLQLIEMRINPENINKNYRNCTICDTRFHSVRREGEKTGRQITIVGLK